MAEATASLLKLFSGRMADKGWNHKKLVVGGYSVSNLARPLIGLPLAGAGFYYCAFWRELTRDFEHLQEMH